MSGQPEIRSYLLSPGDLLHLLKKNRRTILAWTAGFALLASAYTLTRPVQYLAEAKFREMGRRDSDGGSSMTKLLLKSSDDKTGQAIRTMQSRLIGADVMSALGMQAQISESGYLPTPLYNALTHLRVQWAHLMRDEAIALSAPPPLAAEKVRYEQEIRTPLSLLFISDEEFLVKSGSKTLSQGTLGAPLETELVSLTLKRTRTEPLKGRTFNLTLLPLQKSAEKLIKEIKALDDDEDITLVKLSYAHPDKQVAEAVLDALMQSYQGYLSAESERQGELQLGYLLKRQQEMFASQEALMRQHAECLFKESNPSGFVEASREIEFLTKARMQALEKTHALDGQIRYLSSYKLQEAGSHPPLPTLAKCFEELARMKFERDALAQAVAHTNDKDAIEPDEFQGINLEAAKQLHMAYIQEAEERSAGIRKLGFILQQLEDPSFEINSLSSSLPDPICQEIIAKSGQIALRLRDEKNYAPREVERLNGELLTQRRFLQAHLAQAKSLEELKIDLLSKKSRAVKVAMVDLCNEQIALLQKHVEDAVASEVQTLKRQKEQIAAYMGDLSSSLAALPEKWISEQLISQNLALSRASFEELTRLVESKNIGTNLNLVVSHPIDKAYAPPLPKSPNLPLYALLGALLGAFCSISFFTCKTLLNGVEATPGNLRLFTTKIAGALHSLGATTRHPTDHDLAVLRQVVALAEDKRLICTLSAGGPDITLPLAKLYHERGEKVLVVRRDEVQKADACAILSLSCGRRFLPEHYSSEAFKRQLQADYDRILWDAPYAITSSEGQLSKTFADFTVAFVENTSLLNLEVALQEAEKGQLCFVFYSR